MFVNMASKRKRDQKQEKDAEKKRKNHITSHPVFPFENSKTAPEINKSVVNNPYYYKAVSLLDTIMLKLSRYYDLSNYDEIEIYYFNFNWFFNPCFMSNSYKKNW